jgi:hypothetical protein
LEQQAVQLMREGPSESGSRTRLQTAQSCTRATARVVSVCGKGERQARQVTTQKANASEPLMRCRNRVVNAIETRLLSRAWDKVWEEPVFCPGGGRHGGGVSWERGGCAERGNLVPGCQGRTARGKEKPSSGRVPMPGAGTDQLVVAMKAAKAARAKELTCPAKEIGQPGRGGANV